MTIRILPMPPRALIAWPHVSPWVQLAESFEDYGRGHLAWLQLRGAWWTAEQRATVERAALDSLALSAFFRVLALGQRTTFVYGHLELDEGPVLVQVGPVEPGG